MFFPKKGISTISHRGISACFVFITRQTELSTTHAGLSEPATGQSNKTVLLRSSFYPRSANCSETTYLKCSQIFKLRAFENKLPTEGYVGLYNQINVWKEIGSIKSVAVPRHPI